MAEQKTRSQTLNGMEHGVVLFIRFRNSTNFLFFFIKVYFNKCLMFFIQKALYGRAKTYYFKSRFAIDYPEVSLQQAHIYTIIS